MVELLRGEWAKLSQGSEWTATSGGIDTGGGGSPFGRVVLAKGANSRPSLEKMWMVRRAQPGTGSHPTAVRLV